MPTLTIDGLAATVPDGSTLLEAAASLGIAIPTLCHRRGGCGKGGSCLVCVVRNEATGALLPACVAKAADGQRITATSPELAEIRRTTLEMLLAEHLGECQGLCARVCPAGLDIPRILHLAAAGDLGAAAALAGPYPCENCPERCEKACRRGRHDQPVAIKAVVRHLAARGDSPPPPKPAPAYQHRFRPADEADLAVFLQAADPAPRTPGDGFPEGIAGEARRCLHCDCRARDNCQLRDLATSLQAQQDRFKIAAKRPLQRLAAGRLAIEPGKCVKCGQCVALAETRGRKAGPIFRSRGFDLAISPPPGIAWKEAVAGLEEELAAACPTGAMRLDQASS